MATALSVKPPATAMEAINRLSAMVEQAPYRPIWGIPVFRENPKGALLHVFFRLFPGGLAEIRVPGRFVKGMPQGAFRLFLPGYTGPGRDDRRLRKGEALPASFMVFHGYTSFGMP